jgi:hypothetical protein
MPDDDRFAGMPDWAFGEEDASHVRPKSEVPRFKVWTPEEIWAPLPDPDYAIGGLLLKGNLALVCAYGSSFKSWLEIDLLLAKASGGKWLGMFDCTEGPVLLIDWESDDWEDRRRFQAVAKARGMKTPVPGVHMISLPQLFFNSPDFEATVRDLAATYKLICFDTLSAGSPGVEENDTRFAAGLNVLKRIGPQMGCTFVVLHHSRKGQPGGGGDDRESVRGSGAIFAAVDVVLQLFKRDDGGFLVKQTKSRGGKAVEPFVVKVENVADGGVSVFAEPVDEAEAKEASGVGKGIAAAKSRILLLLGTEKDLRSKNAVYRRAKGTKKVVMDAIDELTEYGLIVTHMGAYRLASELNH